MKKTFLFCTCFSFSTLALAQATSIASATTPSRIDNVLVYPGGASVERVVPVKTGAQAQVLRLSCLTARFDPDSLQLKPTAGINIGEVSVQTLDRAAAPECANSPLDSRIRELEDQEAALDAESAAQDLTLGFLKNYGGGEGRNTPNAQITGTAETLRRTGLDALQKQRQFARRKEDIDRQLAPLVAERDRLQAANPQVRTVLVRLAASKDAELHLSYRLAQAGWEPVYRADLDTTSGQLRLERHAQVAQSSGEDWSSVKLRLSTAQPRQASGMPPPYAWNLDILLPNPPSAPMMARAMAAPAPVAAEARMFKAAEAADALPAFDVSVFQGEFATEFEVPGRVDVAATGQRIALALGSTQLDAKVMARTNPNMEAAAYLVAESKRPAGVWPAGNLQLYRDGGYVGQSRLAIANQEQVDLFFGRDEMVRVTAEPEARNAGSTGFIGNRAEQKIGHVYRVENLHQRRFAVQVLEASPVPRHEDIKVVSAFDPKPTTEAWRKQPGVVAWDFTLEPGASQRVSADYTISYPKDARIGGMR